MKCWQMSFGPIPVLTHENLLHAIIHTPSLLSGQNEKAPQENAETLGYRAFLVSLASKLVLESSALD